MRTTLLSTLGGGRKLFLPTCGSEVNVMHVQALLVLNQNKTSCVAGCHKELSIESSRLSSGRLLDRAIRMVEGRRN
jgi:hypothetical protein